MFYIFIFSKPQTPNPSPCNTSVQLHTHDFNSKFGRFLQVPCSFLLGISVRKHRKYKISTFLGSSPCLQWGCSSSFPSQLFPVPETEPGDVDGQAAHTPRQVMREGNQALDVSHPCTNPFVFQKLFESCGFPPTPFFSFFFFFSLSSSLSSQGFIHIWFFKLWQETWVLDLWLQLSLLCKQAGKWRLTSLGSRESL